MDTQTVSFTEMKYGTEADYALLDAREQQFVAELPQRILQSVADLQHSISGYQVTRFEHSLQSATRAYRDGRSEAYVVAALIHDIGDVLAPFTHGEMVAALMKPFFSERLCWIVKHHGVFQMVYYAHHYGEDPNARDLYAGHKWYDDCAEFCELYDQNCFDPTYQSLPLDFFKPMVERIFSQTPHFD